MEIYFYLIALRNKFKDLKNKQPQCKHKRFLHQFLYFFSIKRNAQISKAITYKWPYNSNSFFFCSCLKVFRKFCCVIYTLCILNICSYAAFSNKRNRPNALLPRSNESVQPQTTYLDSYLLLLQENYCTYIQ